MRLHQILLTFLHWNSLECIIWHFESFEKWSCSRPLFVKKFCLISFHCLVYCEYCYKVTRHEKWIEILGDLLWCVALLTVTMQCNYATCHQRCIQEEIIFFRLFLQAINKGRKWLDSIIQRGVKYSYSNSIWITSKTGRRQKNRYASCSLLSPWDFSILISGMGWIIDVMAAEIDKEGKLMNNKFRVNPSHLWRDFRHIFWSSSSRSSRKSSNSKSVVTSHAFKVSYPIFYNSCESCCVSQS